MLQKFSKRVAALYGTEDDPVGEDSLLERVAAGATVGDTGCFPYSESSRREFTFVLAALVNYFDYELVTLFDKTSESRPASLAEISYSVRQPFGNINASLEGFTFLDNFSQHRLELSARLNIRLVRGLQLNINSRILRTKDQIYLPREGATDEDVLLRLRELGTDYRYFLNFSLSYTFGSIFNNIVNPRFN